ncbi:MAG: hypothetical protein ACYC6W_06985 [Nitrosotalea sp.]
MLTATALMGTGMVNWSNTNLSKYQTSLSDTFSTNVNALHENLVVENIWFGNNPSKFLNVTITNTGSVGLNVTDVKLTSSISSLDITSSHTSLIPKQQNVTKIIYGWSSNVPIKVTVTTSRGSVFTSQVMAP